MKPEDVRPGKMMWICRPTGVARVGRIVVGPAWAWLPWDPRLAALDVRVAKGPADASPGPGVKPPVLRPRRKRSGKRKRA